MCNVANEIANSDCTCESQCPYFRKLCPFHIYVAHNIKFCKMLSRPQYVMSKLERMNCTHNTNNCIKIVIEWLLTISILEIAVLAVWTAAHVKVAFLALKDVWMRSVASLHQKNTSICFRSFSRHNYACHKM
jgi:uncharacterized NAD(P)/FAD-binding protein YdhS